MINSVNNPIKINMKRCDGCGECERICPNLVIDLRAITADEYDSLGLLGKLKTKIKGQEKAFVDNPEECVECSWCLNQCHEKAIKYA